MACPTGKRGYATEADAQPHLESLAHRNHPKLAAKLVIYRCRLCLGLHVGHDHGWATHRTTRRGKHRRISASPQ